MTTRLSPGILAVITCMLLAAGPAVADDAQALQARLAADESAAAILQQRLDRTQAQMGQMQVADLFGPSEEEKAAAAAAAQHEQTQDTSLANLSQRLDGLEDSIRRLTGQIEVLDHRMGEINQRIERVQKDFEYRLCMISAQQLGASGGGGGANALPCPPGTAGSAQPPAPSGPTSPPPAEQYMQNLPPGPDAPASGPPAHLAPGPGVLGTLPANGAAAETAPPPEHATQMANVDTEKQFQSAMNLLAHAQYDAASGAFRNFADTFPQDPRAPQALYWFGDIAYVQKDYATAARAFAEGLKKYPTGSRAPDTMLKLAQSLIAMKQKREGCMALRALPEKFPHASSTITQQAEAARKAGNCHL